MTHPRARRRYFLHLVLLILFSVIALQAVVADNCVGDRETSVVALNYRNYGEVPIMTGTPSPREEVAMRAGTFLKDELWPLVKDIEQLAIEACKLKDGFWARLTGRNLSKINDKYLDVSVAFMNAYHKWNTPDELFKGMSHLPDDNVMSAWFQLNDAATATFNQGFRLIDYVDRVISERNTSRYNTWSMIIAVIAVIVAFMGPVIRK